MNKYLLLLILLINFHLLVRAQNYHAVQGSAYTASLNVHNNPATILSTPLPWDVTLVGFQLKSITNGFSVLNYSLLSSPAKSQYLINEGDFARKADLNFNINLLNARFALGRKKAIAFGANIRGYSRVLTNPYNYIDTIKDINNFFLINEQTPSFNGSFMHSTWIELYGSYAQTLVDDERGRLNGGFTLRANRGLSGAYADIEDIRVTRNIQPGGTRYNIPGGRVAYGYSANYDSWDENRKSNQNLSDFLTRTEGGLSLDLGLEYLIKTQAVTSFNDDDDGYYEYEWKIGLSLLDLGGAQFKHGTRSRQAANPRPGLSGDQLDAKFDTLGNLAAFGDTLATIVTSYSALQGNFRVVHPARMVLNVDKYISGNIYINADLSANLSTLLKERERHVRELNLLTITPRWETRRWGAFLPVQVTQPGRFWIGAAFKAGPLLLGIHNLATVFAKDRMQNGGGYLALVIRPGTNTKSERYLKVDCAP